jgi:hypothetical protein
LELVLRLQPVQHFRTLRESLPGDVLEITVQREAGRHLEMREWSLNFSLAACCKRSAMSSVRVSTCGASLKTIDISLWLFTKESDPVELHAVCILDRFASLDAEHHILRVRIFLAQIVAVVGGHHRQA